MFAQEELRKIREQAFALADLPDLPTPWRVALTSLALDATTLDALLASRGDELAELLAEPTPGLRAVA